MCIRDRGSTVHLIILGVSAAMIFLYNSPGKNVFLNIGLGLWDSYNMVTSRMIHPIVATAYLKPN